MATSNTPDTTDNIVEKYVPAQRTANISQVLQDNVGTSITEFDLDRIGTPPGGATQWQVPDLEGIKSVDALEGIIVLWKEPRAYWATSFEETGGGTPPDCSSPDSVKAVPDGMFAEGSDANPTGECAKCPMSQWGSGGGRSQACKQMRVLFMIREGNALPEAVVLPPTSIGPMRRYFLRLASKSVPYYGVVTRLKLERTKNADGIGFAQVAPSLVQVLDDDTQERIRLYGEQFRALVDDSQIIDATETYAEYAASDGS